MRDCPARAISRSPLNSRSAVSTPPTTFGALSARIGVAPRSIARKKGWRCLEQLASALIVYGAVLFLAGLVLTVPKSMASWVFLQPMRSLHLLYILFFLFTGGLLVEFVLRHKAWRWFVLFLPLCGVMYFVQRETFPASSHIEWPGVVPANDWLRAFAWIRSNTPEDAYFALDPPFGFEFSFLYRHIL